MNISTTMKDKTERLYYSYTSAKPFNAEIVKLCHALNGETPIILDKTIFYPDGGGQPADHGTINGVPILDVREKDGEIFHMVSAEDAGKLEVGKAELILDSRRRRDHTQLHTGQHLLSGTFFMMTGALTVSMHMGEETCTIDVDAPEIKDETLIAVEDAVADAIEENIPVNVHLCPPEDISSFKLRKPPPEGEEVIRVVEIGEYDTIACCGTHLKSTAEIGLLRIFGAEKHKGMTRITFLAGRRLLLDSRVLRNNAVIASRSLSVPVNGIGNGVLNLTERFAEIEKRLKAFAEAAVKEKAEALVQKAVSASTYSKLPPIIIESYADEDINEALNIGKIAHKKIQAVFVLASKKDNKFAAYSSVEGFDLRSFLKSAFEAQGGKGGGGSTFFQGSFGTSKATEDFLEGVKKGGA
jgi:alanyl-tRNA synthetase